MTKTIANRISYVLIGCAILLMVGVLLNEMLRSRRSDSLSSQAAVVAATATTIRPIATSAAQDTFVGEPIVAAIVTEPPPIMGDSASQDLVVESDDVVLPVPTEAAAVVESAEQPEEPQPQPSEEEPAPEPEIEEQPPQEEVVVVVPPTEIPLPTATTKPPPFAPSDILVVAINDAGLFERADGSSEQVGYYVPQAQEAALIGRSQNNRWLHVRHFLGVEGWVSTSLFDVTPEDLGDVPISLLGESDDVVLLAPTEAVIPTATPSLPVIYAFADAALFAGPGGSAGHIGYYVPAGRTAWILGISEDKHWYHVLHLIGIEGWVSSRYFEDVDEELLASLPTSSFQYNAETIEIVATPLPLGGTHTPTPVIIAQVATEPPPATPTPTPTLTPVPVVWQPEPTKPIWPTSTPWAGFIIRATATNSPTPTLWPTKTATFAPRATATPRIWPTQTATARATVIAQVQPVNTPRSAATSTPWPTHTPTKVWPTSTPRPAATATPWPTRTPRPIIATRRPQAQATVVRATRASAFQAPTLAPTLLPHITPTATPTLQPGEAPIVSSAIAYWVEDAAASQSNGNGTWRAGLIVRVPTSFRYHFVMDDLKTIKLISKNDDGDDFYALTLSGMTCGLQHRAKLVVEQDGARMQVRNDFSYDDTAVLLKSPC